MKQSGHPLGVKRSVLIGAVQRPRMHFLQVESAGVRTSSALCCTRDQLVIRCTQHINALRWRFPEHALVLGKRPAHRPRLIAQADAGGDNLPETARAVLSSLVDSVGLLATRLSRLGQAIRPLVAIYA